MARVVGLSALRQPAPALAREGRQRWSLDGAARSPPGPAGERLPP